MIELYERVHQNDELEQGGIASLRKYGRIPGGNQEELMSAGKSGRYKDKSRRKDRKKEKTSGQKQGEIGETPQRYAGRNPKGWA